MRVEMATKLLTDVGKTSPVELKEDTVIVVLGASGDLAKKKTVCLIPRLMATPNAMLTLTSSRHFLDW